MLLAIEELLWQIIRKYFETKRYNNSHSTTKNSAYLPGLTNKLKKNKINKFFRWCSNSIDKNVYTFKPVFIVNCVYRFIFYFGILLQSGIKGEPVRCVMSYFNILMCILPLCCFYLDLYHKPFYTQLMRLMATRRN